MTPSTHLDDDDLSLSRPAPRPTSQVRNMFSDSEFLDDIFPEHTNTTERTLGKFHPKAGKKTKKSIPPPTVSSNNQVEDSERDSTTNPSPHFPIVEDHVGDVGAPPLDLEAVVSEDIDDLHCNEEKSGRKPETMPSDIESLDDILYQPTSIFDRTVGKFQPKFQPKSEKPRTVSFVLPESVESVSSPVDFHSLSAHTEGSEWVHSDSTLLDSSQLLTTEDLTDKNPYSQPTISDGSGDLHMEHGRLEGEEAAEFSGLESLGDIIFQSPPRTAQGGGKFQPKLNTKTKKVKSVAFACHDAMEPVCSPWDSIPPEMESSKSPALRPPSHSSDMQTCDTTPILSPRHSMAEQADPSASSICEGPSPDNSESLQNAHVTLERDSTSGKRRKPSRQATPGKVQPQNVQEHSQAIPDVVHISETNKENEAGKSWRQLRKRTSVRTPVNLQNDGTVENGEVAAGTSDSSQMAEGNSDDEYRGEEMPRQKRTLRKSKRRQGEDEKPVQKHRKDSIKPDDTMQEPPKKKFPHSTRRNRRDVDKILLETPEEDIDPRKLSIKDLIMLAEARERISNKEAATSEQSIPNQSDGLFTEDSHYDDNAFAQDQGLDIDGDEANHTTVQPSSTKLNYHTYMNRTRTERWSKSDTELFYQAVRQFGTDFAMIQQLFPNRTRHQVKLKFKNEERKHPLQIADALIHRPTDHSHFELVIQRLQQAQEEQSDCEEADEPMAESQDAAGENEEEGKEKPDKKEEPEENDNWDHGHGAVESKEYQDDDFDWSHYGKAESSSPYSREKDEYYGF